MNLAQLKSLDIDEEWFEPLTETFFRYEINTPKRQAAFIGQCQHESNNFRTLKENLNYSAEALCRVWPTRFASIEEAQPYNRNPEKIANKVYSGRLGNTDIGDGWKYIGRGLIQITGKQNYTLAGDALRADFLRMPDLVLQPRYAALTAGWYWNKRNLNKEADESDYETMTRKINGGLIGLVDRIKHIQVAATILNP